MSEKKATLEEVREHISKHPPGRFYRWVTDADKWVGADTLYELVSLGEIAVYSHPDGLWVGDTFIVGMTAAEYLSGGKVQR